MSTIFYLIRHGEPGDSVNPPLTAYGRQRSSSLVPLLQPRLAGASAIELLYGPSFRTKETAELLGQGLGLTPRIVRQLGENATPDEFERWVLALTCQHALLVTHDSTVNTAIIRIGGLINYRLARDLYDGFANVRRMDYAAVLILDRDGKTIDLIQQP